MCGIVGIRDAGGASFSLYYALYALQHRGQESAGISTYDGARLHKHKGQGLVAEVFDPAILQGAFKMPGSVIDTIEKLSGCEVTINTQQNIKILKYSKSIEYKYIKK